MDKYKNFVVIEEVKSLLRQGKNEEALELTEKIDPRKLRDNYDCMVIGEVFLKNGMLGKARECYNIVYERKKNRRVAMELVNICIRLKKADEAEKYFNDYKKMAPNDYFNHIFKYRIDRLKGRPLKEQAASLEELKRVEFFDNWGYELAKLYHKMGEANKCMKTCEDVIVWFGDGEYVEKAKALKSYYMGEISLKDLNAPKEPEKKEEEESKSEEKAIPDDPDLKMFSNGKEPGTENVQEEPSEAETTPEENSDVKVVPEEDADMKVVPEEDADMKVIPEEDADMKVVPEEDADMKIVPEEDADMKIVPEEELSDAEADAIKIDEEIILKDIKSEDKDIGISTDDLARQVEAVLMEDSIERENRKLSEDSDGNTRVWNREEILNAKESVKEEKKEKAQKPEKIEKPEKPEKTDDNAVYEEYGESDFADKENEEATAEKDSPLLEAVERELGFVNPEEEKPQKKGWRFRWKEKHLEKERKKQEEIKNEEEERRRKEKQEELEKQRFIEMERKKDKQKFLNRQKQLAKLATEKAISLEDQGVKVVKDTTASPEQEPEKKEQEVVTVSKIDNGVYKPKKLHSVEIPEGSRVAGALEKSGKDLEDYFGFFACQKDMGTQIVRCLEQLMDDTYDTMNYCIIGEKGNGKKAIAHGFARFMADCGLIESSQTVWTEAAKVNDIDLSEKTGKLKGRCLVINQAGSLEMESIEDVSKIVEKLHRKVMVVISDYRRNMVELFKSREAFEELFRPRISIPVFNQDDLFDYVDYKVGKAGFVFDVDAYDLMAKRIKGIMWATEEGALARTEKYVIKTLDNAEQRNGEAYIKQTLEHTRHVRSNVIIPSDLPAGI